MSYSLYLRKSPLRTLELLAGPATCVFLSGLSIYIDRRSPAGGSPVMIAVATALLGLAVAFSILWLRVALGRSLIGASREGMAISVKSVFVSDVHLASPQILSIDAVSWSDRERVAGFCSLSPLPQEPNLRIEFTDALCFAQARKGFLGNSIWKNVVYYRSNNFVSPPIVGEAYRGFLLTVNDPERQAKELRSAIRSD